MKKYVLLVLLAVLFFSCKESIKVPSHGTPKVDVYQPIVKSVVLTKSYPGYLKSDKTVNLVARIDGYLQESHLVPGARVKKGDLIFVIEPTTYANDVKQSEAKLATARAQYDYAKSNYVRMKQASLSGAVSQIEVLQAESTLKQQEANIKTANAALTIAQTNLGYCYVRAPMDGRISVNAYDVGNYISGAGQPVTLATLYQDEVMYVYFSVSESEYLQMKALGAANALPDNLKNVAYVILSSPSDTMYMGEMDYSSPSVNLSTGTIEFRAKVNNQNGFLKDGMIISVELPYAKVENSLFVTDASISTDQLGKYVYVLGDSNKVFTRHIEVGSVVDDTLRRVVSGLKVTDYYVGSALLKVSNNMEIEPVKR